MSKKHDKDADADRQTTENEPVTTVGEAEAAVEELGRTPARDVDPDVVPEQLPSSGTIGGPTVVPVGTPNAQARPDLPRLGDGSARGETQPGIPPPGEQERAVDPEKAKELAAQEKRGKDAVTSATTVNGVAVVRYRGGRTLQVNLANVESVEDDGEKLVVHTAGGKSYRFDGDDAPLARSAFAAR